MIADCDITIDYDVMLYEVRTSDCLQIKVERFNIPA